MMHSWAVFSMQLYRQYRRHRAGVRPSANAWTVFPFESKKTTFPYARVPADSARILDVYSSLHAKGDRTNNFKRFGHIVKPVIWNPANAVYEPCRACARGKL